MASSQSENPSPIEHPHQTFLTKEDRGLVKRLAYYQVLQRDQWFVDQMKTLFRDLAGLDQGLRVLRVQDLIQPMNLPQSHASTDIDSAFRWKQEHPNLLPLEEIDLVRPHRIVQPLRDIHKTRTLNIDRTVSVQYNPLWDYRSDVIEELDENLRALRRQVVREMNEVDEHAKDQGIHPMPRREGWEELTRIAFRVFQRTFQNKEWPSIAKEETKRLGLEVPLIDASVSETAIAFAKEIGVSWAQETRPSDRDVGE